MTVRSENLKVVKKAALSDGEDFRWDGNKLQTQRWLFYQRSVDDKTQSSLVTGIQREGGIFKLRE
jgi:hypothetical protein